MVKETEDKQEVEAEEPEKKGVVELVEVPTQVGPAVKLPDGEIVSLEQLSVWIANLVYRINKNTG